MYAKAAIKPNTLLRNGAYGIVMRGVQKCTCAGASLRGRNSAPLCCIKLDTATDIGSGPGAFLSLVEETFPDIQLNALDLSEEMINETKERLSNTAIATVGDSENMPLEGEQYQVVTCNMSIHHYPHPQNALNEMYRILKPGGYLLLNDMDCIAPIRAAANWIFPRLPGGDVKMYRRDEIEEMVRSAGFQNIRYRKISPFSFQCIAEKTL